MSTKSISAGLISDRIFLMRGHKVMLDRDLAELYGVSTKALNQAVKRNGDRFPDDFMFRLTMKEKNELVTHCDRFHILKHATTKPYAFTEQGVAMLSSVLRSKRAVQVNIAIMRAFVRLRETLALHKELAAKLKELEKKVEGNSAAIHAVFEAIRKLMREEAKPKRGIGFHP